MDEPKDLYTIVYNSLQSEVNKIVRNKKIADKIINECFTKIMNQRHEINFEKSVWSLLYTYTHVAANEYRKTKSLNVKPKESYLDAISSFSQDEMYYANFQQNLNNVLTKLSDSSINVITLFLQGLSDDKIAEKLKMQTSEVYAIKKTFEQQVNDAPTTLTELINAQFRAINIIKDEINAELIKYFAMHPGKVHDLDPYQFEKLVAELMRSMGYDVYHTQQTRDGGRDIIAVLKIPPKNEIVTIVQCKRNGSGNIVGIDIVERLIYTIKEKDQANAGWIVTSSSFTEGARNLQKEYKRLLSLRDKDDLANWCSNYGQWQKTSEGGIWLPNDPLK